MVVNLAVAVMVADEVIRDIVVVAVVYTEG